MILYAIRHKPTGNLMWAGPKKRSKGYTYWEPIEDGPALIPRLFHTEHAAKIARTWWLKGRTSQYSYTDYYGEYNISIDTEPVPSRNPDEIDIVSVKLEVEK